MADVTVYVPDIPTNHDEGELVKAVALRLKNSTGMDVDSVKCYSKLGVAVITVRHPDDKQRLISTIETIVLMRESGINISFVDKIDLDSYIVVDQDMKKAPSAEDVADCFSKAYKTSKIRPCEVVSPQFPNIFRINFQKFDELLQVSSNPDFSVKTLLAIVYPRADCNFFEDLPLRTDAKGIQAAIATQTQAERLHATEFYTQYNSENSNAIVIASKTMKKWAGESVLTIDGRHFSKKLRLSYRVLISSVSTDAMVDKVLQHPLFAGRIASHKLVSDTLIVEFNDLHYYNECLQMGGFGIDGKAMIIKPHTVVSNPDSCELDALNWYETAMLEISPDIAKIIHDHQHPIFRYKWNAANFVQQMKKAIAGGIAKGYDRTRHLLRVTVMLNTIGTLRKKKYVVDGNEVNLTLPRLRTVGYNHQSKLFSGKQVHESDWKTPYASTTVKVVNEDCLVLYEQLVAEGRRPLLLNMANATSPGGGYRKGDGAQEENVFRRSDYYQSLDGELADKDRSERLYCTSKGQLKPLIGFASFYPMEEFGAVYTSGITVFRGLEQDGYPYKKEPQCDMSAIAMAAYRDPPLTPKNTLQNRSAVNTHRKIQNIFAIGHHQDHDCLVLSALGCGAFHNPPEHVALLFKSVIHQYAGYFSAIYFAVIDDHNAKGRVNPDGNFRPFERLLHNRVMKPSAVLRVGGASGPYQILAKSTDGQLTLADAFISQVPPCQHGTLCHDIHNADHRLQFSHPSRCLLQSPTSECDQMNDEVHMATFIHMKKCDKGGDCANHDSKHLNTYDHPDFCQQGARCQNISPPHLFAYRHLPICRDGMDCSKYLARDLEHMDSFRHVKSICSHDNCCIQFHDETHVRKLTHSFRQPCPFTPYKCEMFVTYSHEKDPKKVPQDITDHCLQYSHVCSYGRRCATKEDKHYETTIHIARHLCPDGKSCSRIDEEDHLEAYTHPDIRDIRLFCRNPGYRCNLRSDKKHRIMYRHGQNHDHLTVAPSSNFNAAIDFTQNQRHFIRNVNNFIDANNWSAKKVRPEIRKWIRALQPVHRCRKEIFESILVHGHVMSRKYMEKLERPTPVAKAVMQHNQVRTVLLKHNNKAVRDNAFQLIRALVIAEFAKTGADGILAVDPDNDDQLKIAKTRLQLSLTERDLAVIHDWTVKIAQASVALHGAPMGIGFEVDVRMKTDRHVFSILGPHTGHYYGDIVITFKQEIMFHPDSNFSIQAATSFNSGKTYANRPWITDPGTLEKRVEDFHRSKLHCSVPRYEHAAAMELAAVTGKGVKSMDVDIDDILRRWTQVDSHEIFESHLPQLIPLDYVDHVYMPRNVFDSLTPDAQQATRDAFKKSLVFFDKPVDLTKLTPKGTVPLDDTRKPYLQFIFDRINEAIRNRMDAPQISRGIIITVPASNFDEHVVLPLTISKSYELFRLDKAAVPDRPEHTYIYWQAMNGDMMLTLANGQIDAKTDPAKLRCLVCYVAEKPSTTTQDYHENYSYLNDGHPFQHDANVHAGKLRAKSNVFYRGCNTDDFFTFLLQLNYKTNEATLSHAGSNGIYNQEKIQYRFDQTDLDLFRIEYVHISSRNQDVPVRNLTINHEPVPELHPAFDSDFKIDTSNLLKMHSPPMNNSTRAFYSSKPVFNAVERPHPRPPVPHEYPFPRRELGCCDRVMYGIFGSKNRIQPVAHANSVSPNYSSEAVMPAYHPSQVPLVKPSSPRPRTSPPPKASIPRARSPSLAPPLISSKLPPCRDSIYCLQQSDKSHTGEFSHPCRFNELCRRQADEPHLVHQEHKMSECADDRLCTEKADPVHRAQYRHTGLPDFLIPCWRQETCRDTTPEHRQKYFHGEEIPPFKKSKTLAPSVYSSSRALIPCMYGRDCRSKGNPQHTAKYSHPA